MYFLMIWLNFTFSAKIVHFPQIDSLHMLLLDCPWCWRLSSCYKKTYGSKMQNKGAKGFVIWLHSNFSPDQGEGKSCNAKAIKAGENTLKSLES